LPDSLVRSAGRAGSEPMAVVEGAESVTLDLCPACLAKNREKLVRVRNFFLQELGAQAVATKAKKPLDEKSLAERMKPLQSPKQADQLIRLGREALAKKER